MKRTIKAPTGTYLALKLFLLVITLCGFVIAQEKEEVIKISTTLVNVPVIVSDKSGRYVSGLKKEDFFIIENGVKREVDFFADQQAPMSVAIVIDVSPSTQNVLGKIKDAAREFIKVFRPEDQGMIVSFDFDMHLLCDLTSDQKVIRKAIGKADMESRIGSNMFDPVYQIVTERFAGVKGRKAVIVLTDGVVNGESVNYQMLLNALIESDSLIYPIIFESFDPNYLPPQFAEITKNRQISGMNMMNHFANVTGGRVLQAKDKNFKMAFQNIADELKNQYIVGLYPPNLDDGKEHLLKIEVTQKDFVVRTKSIIQLKPTN